MTRKERIAVIRKDEKTIYDRIRHLSNTNTDEYARLVSGLYEAMRILANKRKRLQRKLPKARSKEI